MTDIDDQNEQLRSGNPRSGGASSGDSYTQDPRFSLLLKWVWAALGALALLIGVGVYNKLAQINDTLIGAVSDIKNQGNQVAELKVEVRDLRNSQGTMQRQIDSLEGKTLRGFQEAQRGR